MERRQTEAYGRTQIAAFGNREAEAAVLMKAAALMKHVQTHWAAPDRSERLEKALKYNQRLWSFFQVALADEKNPLPLMLRENILRLSAIVDRRIFETLARPAPQMLDLLININTNIAAGLKSPVQK